MKNDLILGENFWQEYRLIFNYDTLSIRVTNDNEKYFFFDIKINHSHLQILDNQSSLIMKFKRRVFEKCVRKNAQFYLYVVRQVEKNTKTTRTSKEITSLHRTIDHPILNKKLKNDLLKIFRNDLLEQPFSKRSQNHSIDIENAKSINKSFYKLSHEQLTKQTTQIDYLMKRKFVRFNILSWKAFVLFAKKKNEKWRMCINYRAFNAVIQKNDYSLSKI